MTPNTNNKDITITHKGLPADEHCLELKCLQKETNEEIQESQRVMTENQGNIKNTLNTMNTSLNTMNGTINRIFKLYEKIQTQMHDHEKTFHEIEAFMNRKEIQNGYTNKETEDTKHEVDDLNRTRAPIIDRITKLEETKADKKDVNEVLIAVEKIGTTLDAHCRYEKESITSKDRKEELRVTKILQSIVILVMIFAAITTLLWYIRVI